MMRNGRKLKQIAPPPVSKLSTPNQSNAMNSPHYTAIVTNARQGLPVSTRNVSRAPRLHRGTVLIAAGLILFWGCVAFLASLA